MKNVFFTLLLMVFSASVFAINPADNATDLKDRLVSGSDLIDMEMSALNQLNDAIVVEGLTYETAVAKYPSEMETVSATVADGIFSGDKNSPLGIPGFWWGFCLSWVGLLLVYLMMDEGSGRKSQVKNALWGCVIGTLIWGFSWAGIVGVSFLGL